MRGPLPRNDGDARTWATDKLLHRNINALCYHNVMPAGVLKARAFQTVLV